MPRPRLTERYPLRFTIVLTLLALVLVALLASGFTATTIMRGYLVDRVDEQLVQASMPLRHLSLVRPPNDGPFGGGPGRRLPSAYIAQLSDTNGIHQGDPTRAPITESEPLPKLPSLNLDQVRNLEGRPFTVDAVSGGANWRVVSFPLDDGSGTVMIAQSLNELDSTIDRLIGIQAATGVILLILLAGVGTYVVRRSLRGLEDVEHTAVAIAGGDLSRRVPQRDPRTEVGRLSLALNQMLGQIETAFAQRTASEFAARKSEDAARRSADVARASEDNARQSEERMRRFIADASHELRTPLTSIRGFAELTRQRGEHDRPHDDEADRGRGQADGAARRRPAAARPARPATTVAASAGRSADARERFRPRRRGAAAEPLGEVPDPARLGCTGRRGRRGAPTPGARQSGQQRAAPHPGRGADHRLGRHPRGRGRSSRSRIPDRDSTRSRRPRSSSASTAPTRPGPGSPAARVWACQSWLLWSRRTTVV